jgi:hypothetical protein
MQINALLKQISTSIEPFTRDATEESARKHRKMMSTPGSISVDGPLSPPESAPHPLARTRSGSIDATSPIIRERMESTPSRHRAKTDGSALSGASSFLKRRPQWLSVEDLGWVFPPFCTGDDAATTSKSALAMVADELNGDTPPEPLLSPSGTIATNFAVVSLLPTPTSKAALTRAEASERSHRAMAQVDELLCEVSDTLYYIADIYAVETKEGPLPTPAPVAAGTPSKKDRSAIPENLSLQPFYDILTRALQDILLYPVLLHTLHAANERPPEPAEWIGSTTNGDLHEDADEAAPPRKRASSGGLSFADELATHSAAATRSSHPTGSSPSQYEAIDLPLACKLLSIFMRLLPNRKLMEPLLGRLLTDSLPAGISVGVDAVIQRVLQPQESLDRGIHISLEASRPRSLRDTCLCLVLSSDQRVASAAAILLHALSSIPDTLPWATEVILEAGLGPYACYSQLPSRIDTADVIASSDSRRAEVCLILSHSLLRLPLPRRSFVRLVVALLARLSVAPLALDPDACCKQTSRTGFSDDGADSLDGETPVLSPIATQPCTTAWPPKPVLALLAECVASLGTHICHVVGSARSDDASNQLSAVFHVLEYFAEKELRHSAVLPEIIKAAYGSAEPPPMDPALYEAIPPGRKLALEAHRRCNETVGKALSGAMNIGVVTDNLSNLAPIPPVPYFSLVSCGSNPWNPLEEEQAAEESRARDPIDARRHRYHAKITLPTGQLDQLSASAAVDLIQTLIASDDVPLFLHDDASTFQQICQLLFMVRALLAGLRSYRMLTDLLAAATNAEVAERYEVSVVAEQNRLRKVREHPEHSLPHQLANKSSDLIASALIPRYVWDGEVVCLDPLLRLVAPPLDSIRPGETFPLSSYKWVLAMHYPVTLALPFPPVGLPLPGDVSDVTGPLVANKLLAKRYGVVLGLSYIVLVEFLMKPSSRTAGAAPSPAQPSKARALTVYPLHFTFVSTPPSLPTALDVRVISRDALPMSQTLPASTDGAGSYTTSPHSKFQTMVCGYTLVLDTADACADAGTYINLTRRKIIASKIDAILSLEYDFDPFDQPLAETSSVPPSASSSAWNSPSVDLQPMTFAPPPNASLDEVISASKRLRAALAEVPAVAQEGKTAAKMPTQETSDTREDATDTSTSSSKVEEANKEGQTLSRLSGSSQNLVIVELRSEASQGVTSPPASTLDESGQATSVELESQPHEASGEHASTAVPEVAEQQIDDRDEEIQHIIAEYTDDAGQVESEAVLVDHVDAAASLDTAVGEDALHEGLLDAGVAASPVHESASNPN